MLTKELIGLIVKESGLKKKQVEELLAANNAIIRELLTSGHTVQLRGIGTLETKQKKERIIVHPRTGERRVIPSKQQVAFRPVATLKDELKNI